MRAVAVDFDGTLTTGGRPAQPVLDALRATRERGIRVVLATGRIAAELEGVFPDVAQHVDLVCAEDGAVLRSPSWTRALGPAPDPALAERLTAAGVPFRRGQVLLATSARHEHTVIDAIRALGLDCQAIRNRDELMVLPGGVDKGRGVLAALAELGVSRHNTIAVGDAENDLAMMRAVEIGAAPANAVPSVLAAADLLLDGAAGDGVVELLRPSTLARAGGLHPERWRVPVGRDPEGRMAAMPGSRIDVLINGPSGSGKSHLAGMLTEELVRSGYSLLVVDPEGDYQGLREIPGVVVLGGEDALPTRREVLELLRAHRGAIVVDLSLARRRERARFLTGLLPAVRALRRATGLPHWVVVDEAHEAVRPPEPALTLGGGHAPGHLLATYVAAALPPEMLAAIDLEILMPGTTGPAAQAAPRGAVDRLNAAGAGHALVLGAAVPGGSALVRVGAHGAPHVRHWHKYVAAELPHAHRFFFCMPGGAPTGDVATNLVEFHARLRDVPSEVIVHHAAGRDFSRWVGEVLADRVLAERLAEVEWALADPRGGGDVAAARRDLLEAVEERYLPETGAVAPHGGGAPR